MRSHDPTRDRPGPVSHFARWVVPVEGPPIEHGCVVVRGERIAAVGPAGIAEGRKFDWGDALLVPGFVNAHLHLEFSHLEKPLGEAGMSFHDWILHVLECRRAPDFEATCATFAGLNESAFCGVTTLGDIASCRPALLFDEPPQEVDVTSFVELIGLSESRAAAQLERLSEFLAKADRPNARRGVSPHAPYTVRPSLFDAAVRASAGHRLPLAFHLAESREELQLLAEGAGPLVDYMRTLGAWDDAAIPRGTRPLDYLRTLAAAHRGLVIHGNYLADDEIAFLAAQADRLTTVYCPRTHAYFGHEPHPLPKLLAAGASVALGTDGRCTNPDLDLLGELRHVSRTFPQLTPQRVLQLGTLDGARALGLSDEVGSLTPGKRADFVVFETPPDVHDPITTLLYDHDLTLRTIAFRGRFRERSDDVQF